MTPSDYLISCDWGTSSFRLYLVQAADGAIVCQINDGEGNKFIYERWNAAGKPAREEFFLQYLSDRIDLLAEKARIGLHHLPVYISGMASSSVGIRELAYSDLPFSLSGRDLIVEIISPPSPGRGAIHLFSGLCSQNDVMRGEESQIIGLAGYFETDQLTAILPGTHSKHIHIEQGFIKGFHTYMTGEYFALLSHHSILKNSLPTAGTAQPDWNYFAKGVAAGRQLNLLTASFHIRTNDLLHQITPNENYYFLSGLLIGSELKDLPPEASIYLCGGGHLQAAYQKALDILGYQQVTTIAAAQVESAVARAHALFSQKHF